MRNAARTSRVSKITKRTLRNSEGNLKRNSERNPKRNPERNSKGDSKMPVTLGELLLLLPQPWCNTNILCK